MTYLHAIPALFALIGIAACSGGGSSSGDTPPAGVFAEVDLAARAAYDRERLDGMGLAIYDRDGNKVFERMYGEFSADRRVAIASASKLVSGVAIFRLIDQGFLALDSTTAEVLGWTDEAGEITLRHLLSFTSGLVPEHVCTVVLSMSLAECVAVISQTPLTSTPGTRFDYGSTHLHVAARMAEVSSGSAWNDIFALQIRDPLGLSSDIVYYTHPGQANGTSNPLPAGGLRMSMNEYARILRFVFDKGEWQGTPLLDPALFDLQTVTPFPDAAVGTTPAQLDVRYGLTAWLECDTPATGCAKISSPGAFGFTPWLDRDSGYYAILGMEIAYQDNRGRAVSIARELQPLIEAAISRE